LHKSIQQFFLQPDIVLHICELHRSLKLWHLLAHKKQSPDN